MRNSQELADLLLFSFITPLSVVFLLKMVVTIRLRSRTTVNDLVAQFVINQVLDKF